MQPDTAQNAKYLLEKQQVFSRSVLWELQRRYFAERGVEAWRQDEVPHYVTSNLTIANSYAEIVFGLLRDQQHAARAAPGEPLYVCELGAGSGRFAFHFLLRLARLFEQAGPAPFCYILTDFAQSNLDFWRQQPRFQEFFDNGLLDVALFDVTRSDSLSLQRSGRTIAAGSLTRPLVVLANYVFDSIPQDIFYIDNRRISQCRVSLFADEDPARLPAEQLLAHLHYEFDYQALDGPPYPEPYLEQLLAYYQHTLSNSHLLFPAAGLRCLQRLKALSKQGVLLISADKGEHRLAALQGQPPPTLVHHGSFSLLVNYHAFQVFCEQNGGLALFPDYHSDHLSVSALFLLEQAGNYVETRGAYRRHVQDFSPDDFYVIGRHVRPYISQMSFEDILAYVRLGFYDSYQFGLYLPRLKELAPSLNPSQCQALAGVIDKVWESYFPLGEAVDLAYQIACLLYELDDYVRALAYFERSVELYGSHSGTLYNMAACHHLLGHPAQAGALLKTVLKHDPDNQEARLLLDFHTASGPALPPRLAVLPE